MLKTIDEMEHASKLSLGCCSIVKINTELLEVIWLESRGIFKYKYSNEFVVRTVAVNILDRKGYHSTA